MKKYLLLCLVLLMAAAFAEDIEIGFPEHFKAWWPEVAGDRNLQKADHAGSFACIELDGWPCTLMECFTPKKEGYVSMTYTFDPPLKSFKELNVEVFSKDIRLFLIRYVDATGQTLQAYYTIPEANKRQVVSCRLKTPRTEFSVPKEIWWGGAKDKQFHFPMKKLSLLLDCGVAGGAHSAFTPAALNYVHRLYFGKVTVVTE